MHRNALNETAKMLNDQLRLATTDETRRSLRAVMVSLADILARQNRQFQKLKWYAACGLTPSGDLPEVEPSTSGGFRGSPLTPDRFRVITTVKGVTHLGHDLWFNRTACGHVVAATAVGTPGQVEVTCGSCRLTARGRAGYGILKRTGVTAWTD